ncbi:MAG: AAA family ATPase [Candidatus Methanoplasma sp.]|jgi:magnesium chelatase subunit I|nr:AAA family ATPase [Candidatus Methanoplasma sp.]
MKRSQVYPFTAIVGQENMKEALILNTINPTIGGVLIRGEKGTAKSTAVRALADLLPERHVVEGCFCGCEWGNIGSMCPACKENMESSELKEAVVPMKVVELPLSSTEDRVAGTLDIEHAISTGKKKFEAGVLAKANGNILYVDEVNLLDDHLVDLLLDAAAMGVNFIEREGVSYSHPSKFILIGTMNPEEGDLRPQLLDRFGLMVDVEAERDENLRMAVVQRRMEFEKDPEGFRDDYSKQQQELRDKIVKARSIVGGIVPDADVIRAAVRIPLHLQVDGHRADITLIKAAAAYAAMNDRNNVTSQDVLHVTKLVLPHRMRRNPFQDSSLNFEELDAWLRSTFKNQ